MESDVPAIERAIEAAGGITPLANALGMTKMAVWRWRKRGRVPAERTLAVESVTGISRAELRPDIFGKADAA